MIQDWFYFYVYKDFTTHVWDHSKLPAKIIVFLLSSAAHEYIIVVAYRFFYPVLFVLFQGFGLIFTLIPSHNFMKDSRNISFWWSFITGNGIYFALYSQEYYARQNCIVGNSWIDYVTPVSWYCNGLNVS